MAASRVPTCRRWPKQVADEELRQPGLGLDGFAGLSVLDIALDGETPGDWRELARAGTHPQAPRDCRRGAVRCPSTASHPAVAFNAIPQIGRASCRERV